MAVEGCQGWGKDGININQGGRMLPRTAMECGELWTIVGDCGGCEASRRIPEVCLVLPRAVEGCGESTRVAEDALTACVAGRPRLYRSVF